MTSNTKERTKKWARITLIVILLGFVSMAFFAVRASAGTTDLLRHESAFLGDSDFQLNSNWWIRDFEHLEVQAYVFYETSSSVFSELNLTAGYIARFSWGQIAFPMGVRFHPNDDWEASHAISKANLFGRFGDYTLLLINDLSWSLGDSRNEHFLEYQLVYQPEEASIGFGLMTDVVFFGSEEIAWTVGPMVNVVYSVNDNADRKWVNTFYVYPFYKPTNGDVGVKLNFITLRFGK